MQAISPSEVIKEAKVQASDIIVFINRLLKKRAKNGFATIDFAEIHNKFPNCIFNKYSELIKMQFESSGWTVNKNTDSDERDPSPRGSWWEFFKK